MFLTCHYKPKTARLKLVTGSAETRTVELLLFIWILLYQNSLIKLLLLIIMIIIELLSYLVPDVEISPCLDQQFDTVRETMPRHLMQRSVSIL